MKNILIIVLGLVSFCCSPALAAESLPGNFTTTAPFNVPVTHFTSAKCVSETFDCNTTLSKSTALQKAANCATETLGFSNTKFYDFMTKGIYNRCALPVNVEMRGKEDAQKTAWPICCVVPSGNACTFECHMYLSTQ